MEDFFVFHATLGFLSRDELQFGILFTVYTFALLYSRAILIAEQEEVKQFEESSQNALRHIKESMNIKIEIKTSTETWPAEYAVQGNTDAKIVRIKSRSNITVIIARIVETLPLFGTTGMYYISMPNYGIAIPEINDLSETAWIGDKLAEGGMPYIDAITVAQVLKNIYDEVSK